MKIAYLLNTFPLTSTTFIRREIEALEGLGVTVRRFAVRRWNERLVDPRDLADQQRTEYLLSGNVSGLVWALLAEAIVRPIHFARGVMLWLRLVANRREVSARLFAYLMQACLFRRRCAEEGIDHVHAHFSTNATAVAMLAQAMGGSSYSFTAHGPDEFVDPTPASLGLKVRRAAFVVAISDFCRSQLALAAGHESLPRIVIGRCGLALEEFPPAPPIEADHFDLVCVGRLCPQKAQTLIPQALARLRDEHPRLRVHFVGDGESRRDLEQAIARHGVADRCILHGWKNGAEVKALIASSRALLLPSLAEGLPVVIMEALALRRPVLSTFIAGIPELVDARCGWLVPAGSLEGLTQALRQVAQADPATLNEMGRVGRQRVEALHDVQSLARLLEGRFASLASTSLPDPKNALVASR